LIFMKALHLMPRSSSGARALARRLASERSERIGRATAELPAASDRDPLELRRKGRAS
jgi:hypothetical protein